jgi:hypothetical protein
LDLAKPGSDQQPANLCLAISPVPPGQPDQVAAPVRAADDQHQHASGFQQPCHAVKRGLRVGQMLQQMRGGDKIAASGYPCRAVEVAQHQPGAARAYPRLGRAQHGRRRVNQRQR